MSSQMMMPAKEADAGFELLKDIVALAKNPKAIDEAHQRIRDQAALTQSEVAKANEARELIAKADQIKAELEQREKAIESDKAAHQAEVSAFHKEMKGKIAQLDEKANALNIKESAHVETDRRHVEERGNLDAERNVLQGVHDEAMAKVKTQEIANAEVKQANEAESARLAALGKELNNRLAKVKLREQASDL